jgi:hypothetical protein
MDFDFDPNDEACVLRDDYLVRTVGFVMRDDDTWLSIAQEQLPEGDGWRAVTHIPQALIRDRVSLEEGVLR